MELGIRGQRALVTGSSRGIGRAAALALAREGARVAICARGSEDLDRALAELHAISPGHVGVAVDLVEDGGPAKLLDALRDDFGMPEIVVHNLGATGGVRDPLPTVEQWRFLFRINFEVAAELNATFVPAMVERGYGRICAISSLAAFEVHGSIGYGAAKAALTAYTRGLGRTYAGTGLVVTAIVPGVVMTEGGHWEQNLRNDPAYVEQYVRERLPRGVFGTAEEVAAAVVFLCSQHAVPFIGSIVPLEGGQARSFFGQ